MEGVNPERSSRCLPARFRCMTFGMADDRNTGVQRFRSNYKHPVNGPV